MLSPSGMKEARQSREGRRHVADRTEDPASEHPVRARRAGHSTICSGCVPPVVSRPRPRAARPSGRGRRTVPAGTVAERLRPGTGRESSGHCRNSVRPARWRVGRASTRSAAGRVASSAVAPRPARRRPAAQPPRRRRARAGGSRSRRRPGRGARSSARPGSWPGPSSPASGTVAAAPASAAAAAAARRPRRGPLRRRPPRGTRRAAGTSASSIVFSPVVARPSAAIAVDGRVERRRRRPRARRRRPGSRRRPRPGAAPPAGAPGRRARRWPRRPWP